MQGPDVERAAHQQCPAQKTHLERPTFLLTLSESWLWPPVCAAACSVFKEEEADVTLDILPRVFLKFPVEGCNLGERRALLLALDTTQATQRMLFSDLLQWRLFKCLCMAGAGGGGKERESESTLGWPSLYVHMALYTRMRVVLPLEHTALKKKQDTSYPP